MKPVKRRIVIDADNHYCTDIDGLFDKLRTEDGSVILMENGLRKLVHLQGISREDGSGFSFVVSVFASDFSKMREIYVNDVDGRRKAEAEEEAFEDWLLEQEWLDERYGLHSEIPSIINMDEA
tara:strand:+ start:489 stop:857 length:369 start_codon:yes stop_codon:yes gene_type:complete